MMTLSSLCSKHSSIISPLNHPTMARLSNLNGVSDTLPGIPKLPSFRRTRKRAQIVGTLSQKNDHISSQEHNVKTTRRLALSLASIALVSNTSNGVSLAEDNGLWVIGPLPVPSAKNNIANEKTGTRSFLKKGIFMAHIGAKNQMYRVRKYAFDLLAMEDLVKKDTLNYVQKYVRLKCTPMYFDFDDIITAAKDDDKQPLTDLANKFFDNIELLDSAAKERNFKETENVYEDTKVLLQEVMERMEAAYKLA